MNFTVERVADEIQSARKGRKLSQQILADKVGVTRATISNIERGHQSLSLDLFCRIASALSVDPPSLLEKVLLQDRAIDLSDVPPEIGKAIEEAISTK